MRKKSVLAAVILSACTAMASEQDSLKLELERINEQIRAVELRADSGAAKVDTAADSISLDRVERLLNRVNDRMHRTDPQGFGGSGGIYGGAAYVDMRPIRDLISRDVQINGTKSILNGAGMERAFGSREVFGMIGGIGIGGVGNGVRIGGAGINGEQDFAVIRGDSLFRLETELSYGGLIIAKQFGFDRHNLTIAGLFGGGSWDVNIYAERSDGSSGLKPGGSSDWDENDNASMTGSANFFVTDLSVNYTYSILRWMHIGADLGGFLQHSGKGFNGTDGFTTVNPVGRVRILFGRLG